MHTAHTLSIQESTVCVIAFYNFYEFILQQIRHQLYSLPTDEAAAAGGGESQGVVWDGATNDFTSGDKEAVDVDVAKADAEAVD